jgi:glutamyl-tRNA synthetase
MAYKEMGFLPESLINYLVRLGWAHGDQEIFSLPELVNLFSLESVGKSPAVFNPEKLLWLNAHYIKEASPEIIYEEMKPLWPASVNKDDADFVRKVIADLQPRSKTLVELAATAGFYFTQKVQYEEEAARKFLTPEIASHLAAIVAGLSSLQNFSKEGIEQYLQTFVQEREIKLKVIAQPLRVALTGKTVSPGIDEVMVTLGKDRVIKRIQEAQSYISETPMPKA